MTKIRKVKRNKKYRYNVNRKRMNKKRLPKIENSIIMKAWNPRTSSQKNFKNLGLVFDVNKDIKKMNREDNPAEETVDLKDPNSESVINKLEKEAKLSKTKEKNFRFSADQVKYITYLMDKYGEDYKAMSRDKKNYLQQTWKQIRRKITQFKSIPEQYEEYLKNKEV